MHEDDVAKTDPTVSRALPIVVGIVALVALAGALGYIVFTSSSPTPAPTAPPTVRLTLPASPAFTRSAVDLRVQTTGRAYDVQLEFRTQKWHDWSPVPARRLSTPKGAAVSVPLKTDARGRTAVVRWDIANTTPRDPGIAPENAIKTRDAVISVRAVAKDKHGDPVAGAPVYVVLTRYPPTWITIRAPSINDGVVFSGDKPIHIAWSPAPLWYDLPDGRTVGVPIAGYAVDLVDREDVDAGHLPPARIATRGTSYNIPVPPPSDQKHAVIVRTIDVAGNVGLYNIPPMEFRSESFVLQAPRQFAELHGADPVPLRALDEHPGPMCFEYRFPGPNETGKFLPIPPGEVTNAAGKPVGSWPVKTARTGRFFYWNGLRHAPGFANRELTRVELQVVRTTATAHGCGAPVAVSDWVPIYWSP